MFGEKNTPPEKTTGWRISFESARSGAGLQFLLLGRMAKAHVKGVFFSEKPPRGKPSPFGFLGLRVCVWGEPCGLRAGCGPF